MSAECVCIPERVCVLVCSCVCSCACTCVRACVHICVLGQEVWAAISVSFIMGSLLFHSLSLYGWWTVCVCSCDLRWGMCSDWRISCAPAVCSSEEVGRH